MACNFPKIYNGCLCPCGKCAGCIRSKRNVWITRTVLESMCHETDRNFFITLTYDPEHYPEDGLLKKRDVQLFFKRLRKRCGQCRYVICGEYGKKTFRPHYHAIIFGFGGSEKDIRECWSQGFIVVGTVTPASCAYVCKYISKRYDPVWQERLEFKGLTPEFSLMSRRPGIGFPAVERIVNAISTLPNRSVPTILRIGGRIMVLGRYLRQKIQEMIGVSDEEKQNKLKGLRQELQAVLEDYYGIAPHPLSAYISIIPSDGSGCYLHSLERPDKDYVIAQRDNSFVGKL